MPERNFLLMNVNNESNNVTAHSIHTHTRTHTHMPLQLDRAWHRWTISWGNRKSFTYLHFHQTWWNTHKLLKIETKYVTFTFRTFYAVMISKCGSGLNLETVLFRKCLCWTMSFHMFVIWILKHLTFNVV